MIQRSFGAHDLSAIQAHVGGPAAAASAAMGAEAYATGQHVAFARSPDLHTAAHEAAHVVQQRAGVQLKGGVGEAGDAYERHADQVADLVVQARSAESLLSQYAGTPDRAPAGAGMVQRREESTAPLPAGDSAEPAPAEAEATAEEDRELAAEEVPPDAFANSDGGGATAPSETPPSPVGPEAAPTAPTSPPPTVASTAARPHVAQVEASPAGRAAPGTPPSTDQNQTAAPKTSPAESEVSTSPARVKRLLRGQYEGLRKLFIAGKLDQGQVVEKMIAYDCKLNGGVPSPDGLGLMMQLIQETTRLDAERRSKQQTKQKPAAASAPASAGSAWTRMMAQGAQGAQGTQGPAPARSSSGGTPALAPVPSATVTDERLASLVAALRSPEAEAIAAALAGLQAKARALPKDRAEEQGTGRDELVAGIGVLRSQMDRFKGSGLDAKKLQAFRAAVYRAIQDLAPFYFQSRNIDVLELPPAGDTRTCNVTSLSMALESLGRSAANYTGDRAAILAIAAHYLHKVQGDKASPDGAVDAVGGKDSSWAAVSQLRLPDFMQFAAIARELKGPATEASIKAAAQRAWNSIKGHGDLVALAKQFGVGAEIKRFDATGTKGKASDYDVLRAHGKTNRSVTNNPVEKYINAVRRGESALAEKLRPAYEKAISGAGIEDRLSLDDYRQHVISAIGADLEAGRAVVIGMANHFARLQAVHPEHIIVDDPAQAVRSGTVTKYEEARAMGYFYMRIVLS